MIALKASSVKAHLLEDLHQFQKTFDLNAEYFNFRAALDGDMLDRMR